MSKKQITTNEYSFTVIYESVKEGGYQVIVPLLQGLVSYGRNFEEARKMAREAILCYLEALKKDHSSIPIEEGTLQEKITVCV